MEEERFSIWFNWHSGWNWRWQEFCWTILKFKRICWNLKKRIRMWHRSREEDSITPHDIRRRRRFRRMAYVLILILARRQYVFGNLTLCLILLPHLVSYRVSCWLDWFIYRCGCSLLIIVHLSVNEENIVAGKNDPSITLRTQENLNNTWLVQ